MEYCSTAEGNTNHADHVVPLAKNNTLFPLLPYVKYIADQSGDLRAETPFNIPISRHPIIM
jgi:hypothetical protein